MFCGYWVWGLWGFCGDPHSYFLGDGVEWGLKISPHGSPANITARELQHLVEELTLDISYLISWSTAQRPEDTAVPVA